MKNASRLPRSLLATLLAGAALLGGIAPATARADTAAVAVNVRDGATVYRIVFQIRRVAGDTVDETNAAVAYASCTGCETVAISIQVLLVLDEPSVVTPENLALAMNVDCLDCQTLASAYQFLVGAGGPVHFTADGNRRIAQIRRELTRLRHSGLSIFEIQQRVAELMQELGDVLSGDLVAAGPPARAASPPRTGAPSPAASAGASPTAEPPSAAAPVPAGTPVPSPTATPDASAAPAPGPASTDTPSPEPTATETPAQTPTATPAPEQTASATPEPTASPTPEPTATPTPEPTGTPTAQPTPTPTP